MIQYRNVRPLVIQPDKPQPHDWHARILRLIASIKNDETGSADSQKLVDALDKIQIRGGADGFEFNGYDYDAQTWLTFTYAEHLPL